MKNVFKGRKDWPAILLLITILAIWTGAIAQQGNQSVPGPLGPNNIGYFGNAAKDNGSDYIGGLLINNSTLQSARDYVGISATGVWAPDAVSPANPFGVEYDSLFACALGPQNTVLSTTLTACTSFSANETITAGAGQTINLADSAGYTVNPPVIVGAGTENVTRRQGVWVTNQGNAKLPTSYGVRIDAQSGSTANLGIFSAAANSDQLGNLSVATLASVGTPAGIAGTGACATFSTQTGGPSVGSFVCTGSTGAATITITPGKSQAHGYNCTGTRDITTPADAINQTFFSQTVCQLTAAAIANGDTITFQAVGF